MQIYVLGEFFLAYCNKRVINLFFSGRTFDRYLSPSFSPFLRTMAFSAIVSDEGESTRRLTRKLTENRLSILLEKIVYLARKNILLFYYQHAK